MSKIEITGFALKKYKKLAEFVAEKTLALTKQPKNVEVAIEFVSKGRIKKLNREIRGIDKVTDVLSFPSTDIRAGEILDVNDSQSMVLRNEDGFIHFGDMALCLPICKKQAREYNVSVFSEIKKLVIHSCLHLMGYDHIADEDYEIMHKKELELDKKIVI